jgi:hypothetical protein
VRDMNTTVAGSQAMQTPLTSTLKCTPSTRRDDASRPSQADASPEQRDAFELALRRKSKRDDDDQQHEPQSDAAAAALAAAFAAGLSHHAPRTTAHAAPPAPASIDNATGTRAAIEAALNSNPAPLVTAVGATDPAALWEASISEPNGVAVDVRALRSEPLTPQAQPGWDVTVSSSAVDAEVLVRHAPRLNERLRKHAVGFSHVRIESSHDEAE